MSWLEEARKHLDATKVNGDPFILEDEKIEQLISIAEAAQKLVEAYEAQSEANLALNEEARLAWSALLAALEGGEKP